jgi:hypothetical protein
MAVHNNLLINAASAGFFAGALGDSLGNGETPDSNTLNKLVTAAENFGAVVDAAIPNDATISVAGGGADPTALAPTTGAIQDAQLYKSTTLYNLSYAAAQNRLAQSNSQAQLTPVANAVVAAYTASLVMAH